MLALLKKVTLTALMVCVATALTSTCAGVLTLFVGAADSPASAEPGLAVFAFMAAGLMSLLVGILLCMLTLFIAAVTMPPVLLATTALKLPRPAMDMVGGAMAGLLCAMMSTDLFDSAKSYGLDIGPMAQIIAVMGLGAGCALGYVRHRVLKGIGLVAPQGPAGGGFANSPLA